MSLEVSPSVPAGPTAPHVPPTIRVLHLINGEHYSGAERMQDLLAQALPRWGCQVGFVALKAGRFAAQRSSQDAPLETIEMRSRFDRHVARRITAWAQGGGYHVLHAHTPRTLLVGQRVARQTGLPLVYHVHSPAGRDSTRGWQNRVNQWVESRCLRRVAAMICVSQSVARYMESLGHERSKIRVVPNGVPKSRQSLMRRRPKGEWTLGTVALFRPRKGVEVLLDAVAELKRRGTNVRLLAVGPFEAATYQAEVLARAAALDIASQIEWTGFASDVESHLKRMDLFVLPSLFGEGLPMVVLEAMAVGVPIIASRVEGIPEAIRHGLDGLVCEPGDAVDLAARIRSVIDGEIDWLRMSRSAQERQRRSFSETSMARNVAAVYREVLSRAARS